MEAKFTPGPWKYHAGYIDAEGCGLGRPRVGIVDDGVGIDDPDANGKLMAASPLLYEALRHQLTMLGLIVNAINAGVSVNPAIEAATILINNALCAARGEE